MTKHLKGKGPKYLVCQTVVQIECLADFFWFFQWPKCPFDVCDCEGELKKNLHVTFMLVHSSFVEG